MAWFCLWVLTRAPGDDPGHGLSLFLAFYFHGLQSGEKSTQMTKVISCLATFGLNPPGTLWQAEIASSICTNGIILAGRSDFFKSSNYNSSYLQRVYHTPGPMPMAVHYLSILVLTANLESHSFIIPISQMRKPRLRDFKHVSEATQVVHLGFEPRPV